MRAADSCPRGQVALPPSGGCGLSKFSRVTGRCNGNPSDSQMHEVFAAPSTATAPPPPPAFYKRRSGGSEREVSPQLVHFGARLRTWVGLLLPAQILSTHRSAGPHSALGRSAFPRTASVVGDPLSISCPFLCPKQASPFLLQHRPETLRLFPVCDRKCTKTLPKRDGFTFFFQDFKNLFI